MMKNFAPEFKSPEHYIIDITYRIWEERGVGLIRDWYAAEGPVRTPHGETFSAEAVVAGTLATLHEFPDRQLFAEDVIIGEFSENFLSSHRVRSTATHLGDDGFGPATQRPIVMLTLADCLCQDNQIIEEWLVRDQAGIAQQLGLDPVQHGKTMGLENPENYTIGNEAFIKRWNAPDGLTIVGDEKIANRIMQTYDSIWNDKNLNIMDENYDRALRFEGPTQELHYGRYPASNFFNGVLASIPDGRYEPHHVIVREDAQKALRVALRWSHVGTQCGHGRYGASTQVPLALLGVSHFELRDGKIVNEWMCIDETAIHAQIAAYSAE